MFLSSIQLADPILIRRHPPLAEGGSFEHTPFDGSTPPKPSSLDANLVNQLLVQIDPKEDASSVDLEGLLTYQRAANYIAAAQIFLRSNGMLKEELTHNNIKKRLLGHWGTCAVRESSFE